MGPLGWPLPWRRTAYWIGGAFGLALFLGLNVIALALYFTVASASLSAFYAVVLFLGIANGYWAVFVTSAAEQFGTNLRATATTTAVIAIAALFGIEETYGKNLDYVE